MNDREHDSFDLSVEASRSTIASAASYLGWILLIALSGVTAVHAIALVEARTHLSAQGGDLFDAIRIGGIVLVELFALVTAAMLATHKLRAKQKPMAMVVEATWFIFAAINLVSSFAIEAGGPMPSFVESWITYGLPVSALIMGALFYITLRLDPSAGRADEEAETRELFAAIRHRARREVLGSEQMRAVIRQAEWQKLPAVVGRQMNLTDVQIQALIGQAPKLLDLNQNGIPDIQEQHRVPSAPSQNGRVHEAFPK